MRASSGMVSPSVILSKVCRAVTCRMPVMMSLMRLWAIPVAEPMRCWLAPCWRVSCREVPDIPVAEHLLSLFLFPDAGRKAERAVLGRWHRGSHGWLPGPPAVDAGPEGCEGLGEGVGAGVPLGTTTRRARALRDAGITPADLVTETIRFSRRDLEHTPGKPTPRAHTTTPWPPSPPNRHKLSAATAPARWPASWALTPTTSSHRR